MMTLLAAILYLAILGVVIWLLALVLEMVIEGSGLPRQLKPIILAVVGLVGIIWVLNRFMPLF